MTKYSHHPFGIVPLKRAMICWDPKSRNTDHAGSIELLPHPPPAPVGRRLHKSIGACFMEWQTMSDNRRLLHLFIYLWDEVRKGDLIASDVHECLMGIPEYAEIFSGENSIW